MSTDARRPALQQFDEAEDVGELKRRSADLHRRMVSAGPFTYLPTAGVFLTISNARFSSLVGGKVPDDFNDNDAKAMYQIGHESVHVAQVVVSPWLYSHVSNLASIVASTRQRDRQHGLDPAALAQLKQAAAAELASVEERKDGFTVTEIMEAQAVVQGMKWTAVKRDADWWRWAVDNFHDGAPTYIELLHQFADELELGNTVAFDLLPRLCALALQTGDPRSAMAALANRIQDPAEAVAAALLRPLEFCHWAGVDDPSVLDRSLRERDPALFQRSPWSPLYERYFDQFEQIAGTAARMNILLGSDYGAPGARIFRPLYAVFGDGAVRPFHGEVADYEIWVRITLTVLDTLEFLKH